MLNEQTIKEAIEVLHGIRRCIQRGYEINNVDCDKEDALAVVINYVQGKMEGRKERKETIYGKTYEEIKAMTDTELNTLLTHCLTTMFISPDKADVYTKKFNLNIKNITGRTIKGA